MTDRLKEYLAKNGNVFGLEKTEVEAGEALLSQEENGEKTLKPGYAKTYDYIDFKGYRYYRYDLSDADEEYAKTVSTLGSYKLLNDFMANMYDKLDKIHFWVRLWSIVTLAGIAVSAVVLFIRAIT